MSIEFFGGSDSPTAILIRRNARVEGIKFFSPSDYPQQLGLMTRPRGYIVPAHKHNQVARTISETQEVLLLRSGKCKVSLLSDQLEVLNEIIIEPGDVIFLAHGAHRIEMLEESELLEVKQGPYAGDLDKTILEQT